MRAFPLTTLLIALNLLIYAYIALTGGYLDDIPPKTLALHGALYGPAVVFYGEWWRLFTAMFLHGGAMHLAMNMMSLYIVGRGAELYFSKAAYLTLYLASGLFGALASLYAHPLDVAMGASGAIFGIFGALMGFFIVHRRRLAQDAKAVFQDFATIIALNVVLGLAVPSIDMSAHIGGFMTGLIGGIWLAKRPSDTPWFALTCAVALALGARLLQGYYAEIFI